MISVVCTIFLTSWAVELDIDYLVDFIGKLQKMACSLSSNPIPRHIIYKNALRRDLHKHVLRIQKNIYALSQCNEVGKPTYKYVVIEKKKCNQDGRTAYICSCDIANCIHQACELSADQLISAVLLRIEQIYIFK